MRFKDKLKKLESEKGNNEFNEAYIKFKLAEKKFKPYQIEFYRALKEFYFEIDEIHNNLKKAKKENN